MGERDQVELKRDLKTLPLSGKRLNKFNGILYVFLFILNQVNLVHDLSHSNSLPLADLLFIRDQVKLIRDLNKFDDIPYTFHRLSSFHPESRQLGL